MPTNMYLKIEGPNIDGESTDTKHKNQIEVLSWSHEFSQSISPTRSSAGGGTVERARHTDLSFTKYTDTATADLLKNCWRGQHFDKMTLSCYRDGGSSPVEYLNVVMEHVVISRVKIGGGSGDIPVENISLSYGKVTYKYDPQDEKKGTAGGAKPASHDLATNTVA